MFSQAVEWPQSIAAPFEQSDALMVPKLESMNQEAVPT